MVGGHRRETDRPCDRRDRLRPAPEPKAGCLPHHRSKAGPMRTCRLLSVLTLTAACAGCGDSPSAPSTPADAKGPLEGVWTGTLSVTVRGDTLTSPATVTFTTTPLTATI